MSVLGFLLLLLIAAIAGAIGQAIAGWRGGLLASIGIGLVGALLGMFVANALGLPMLVPLRIEGTTFPLVWSILGSVLFVVILGLIMRTTAGPPRHQRPL